MMLDISVELSLAAKLLQIELLLLLKQSLGPLICNILERTISCARWGSMRGQSLNVQRLVQDM